MTNRFAELMFSPAAKALQAEAGSRPAYARFAAPGAPANDRFGPQERAFIAARDSFYMATVTHDCWPYFQHHGGAPGFLTLLDDRTIGFAEYRGNKQFVSLGNLATDDRVALFLMDYPNQRRLKILGHARRVELDRETVLATRLIDAEQPATGAVVIVLEGFDWNCPQYITPRYTDRERAAIDAERASGSRAAPNGRDDV